MSLMWNFRLTSVLCHNVAVPNRNQTLLDHVFQSHCHIWSTVLPNFHRHCVGVPDSDTSMQCVRLRVHYIYMILIFNKHSTPECFQQDYITVIIMHTQHTIFLWFFPALELTLYASTHLSWRKLTPPLNSSCTVTQHSLLATRTTWTTQITCPADLYSRSVLHCTYLIFVPYKDISHVHFDGACTTVVHTGLGWS